MTTTTEKKPYSVRYYELNKERISKNKQLRYKRDPEYRKQARLNARLRREELKALDGINMPRGCDHLLKDVCDDIDLKVPSFHTMVFNGYIPEVQVYKRKAYLSTKQKALLERLVATMGDKERKALSHPTPETAQALEDIKQNWD